MGFCPITGNTEVSGSRVEMSVLPYLFNRVYLVAAATSFARTGSCNARDISGSPTP